jgi:hypothetical protein
MNRRARLLESLGQVLLVMSLHHNLGRGRLVSWSLFELLFEVILLIVMPSNFRGRWNMFPTCDGAPHAVKHVQEFILALSERKHGNDNGSSESPGERNQHPEGEIALGEDANGSRKSGPQNNQNERQSVSAASDPEEGPLELNRVLCANKMDTAPA